MRRSKMVLPPLNALRTFEAAARHGSFKEAAEELFVTQSAISRQVQSLEDFYGLSLFHRGHRRVELTPEGEFLFVSATSALQHIASASRSLQTRSASGELNLLTTSAFAQLWLIPRLKDLRNRYPGLQLHLVTADAGPDMVAGFDIAVSLGWQDRPHYCSQLLFSEEVFPVCTPEYLDQNPTVGSLGGLMQATLLNLNPDSWEVSHWEPIDWNYWFKQAGRSMPAAPDLINFSHFPTLMEAVDEGMGIGLAWRHLVQHKLDSGVLVRPVAESCVMADRQHFLVCRSDWWENNNVSLLRDWLLEQVTL